MDYTIKYNELKNIFNTESREIQIPGSDIRIVNTDFISIPAVNDLYNRKDVDIAENISFSYPVFVPSQKDSKKVILLLHGLNERSWQKYLAWAYYLAGTTGSYVILFPISFHINRSPESWKDPRAMVGVLNERKMAFSKLNMASIANIALSRRLTEDPLRFFNSGHQTANDLIRLMQHIKNGKHPIIPGGSRVNVFAYSIGAFLAQIMFMGNPENLFSESKLFLFCGGSVFSNMQGTSKLIMDNLAYEKVYHYYMEDFERETEGKSQLMDYLRSGRLGMAFRSMIDLGRFKKFREQAMKGLRDQIHSVGLLKDMVIPPKGILNTLYLGNVEVWDFPYAYSHENPFPINEKDSAQVDSQFERLFSSAAMFLV